MANGRRRQADPPSARSRPIAGAPLARFDDLVAGRAMRLEGHLGTLVAHQADQVVPALGAVEEATATGCWAAGFVSYDAAPGLDPCLTVPAGPPGVPPGRVPLVWFGLFERCRAVAPVSEEEPCGPALAWTLATTYPAYRRKVAAVRAAIAEGRVYQCNLTERFEASSRGDPEALYRSLALAQRGRYSAYVGTGDLAVASASPELFFEWRGDQVVTQPMKGTARRGRWAAEDQAAAAALVASAKDRAENVMIVDLLRNDLGRLGLWGSVEVRALFELERLETVWQLTSTVTARLPPDARLVDIFRALFPSGSVTGAPKPAAMALISQLETSPRQVYCGAVGLVAPRALSNQGQVARARFNVAIRTAVVDRASGTARYGAGGGLTWSSRANDEWDELHAKARLLALEPRPFRLLETMRYDPADTEQGPFGLAGVHNADGHLSRLASSAAYFGFSCDLRRVVTALLAAIGGAGGPQRVRLLLDRHGAPEVQVGEVPPAPEVTRLVVDPEPVDLDGPWAFHKTTRREPYETRAARHPEADDVVLVNGRGEVTETTTANLAVRTEGQWWTPPVACGCLPGVGRARLLAAGVLAERVITLSDLLVAQEVALISSLRGWRRAVVLPSPGR